MPSSRRISTRYLPPTRKSFVALTVQLGSTTNQRDMTSALLQASNTRPISAGRRRFTDTRRWVNAALTSSV